MTFSISAVLMQTKQDYIYTYIHTYIHIHTYTYRYIQMSNDAKMTFTISAVLMQTENTATKPTTKQVYIYTPIHVYIHMTYTNLNHKTHYQTSVYLHTNTCIYIYDNIHKRTTQNTLQNKCTFTHLYIYIYTYDIHKLTPRWPSQNTATKPTTKQVYKYTHIHIYIHTTYTNSRQDDVHNFSSRHIDEQHSRKKSDKTHFLMPCRRCLIFRICRCEWFRVEGLGLGFRIESRDSRYVALGLGWEQRRIFRICRCVQNNSKLQFTKKQSQLYTWVGAISADALVGGGGKNV